MSERTQTIRSSLIRELENYGASLARDEWRALLEQLAGDMHSRIECMDEEDEADE